MFVKEKYRLGLCFVAFLTGLVACNKLDTTSLGSGLIPEVDNVNTFDTVLTVEARNFEYTDSVFMGYSEDFALGTIQNDPMFGKTTASIQVQFSPASFKVYPFANHKDSIIAIDSVVLALAYKGAFGDTTLAQKFSVYAIDPAGDFELGKNSATISPYPTLTQKVNDPGTGTVDMRRLRDSMEIKYGKDTVKVANQLRIKLDTVLVGRLLASYDTTDGLGYNSAADFTKKNKGYAIVTDSTAPSNALMYFNLNDQNTALYVYYKVIKAGKIDTTFTAFGFTGNVYGNFIRRTNTGSAVESYLNNGTGPDDQVFLNTLPGTYSIIDIPGFTGLSNRIVHKAELIMEQIPDGNEGNFYLPSILYMDAIDTAGHFPSVIDPMFYNSGVPSFSTFGGVIHDRKDQNGNTVKGYSFDFTRYTQMIATSKTKNFQLRLMAGQAVGAPYGVFEFNPYMPIPYPRGYFGFNRALLNPVARGRVKVGGGNNATNKMRVRIIYSKI